MPRGKRKTQTELIEDQLIKIDVELEANQAKIKELEDKKQELLDLKKKQTLDDLYSKIQASGKTIEEVLQSLK